MHSQTFAATNNSGQPLPPPVGNRLLIVEDDAELASILSAYLRQDNFDVRTEGRGDRAVARVMQEQPDIIVLDLMLPGKNGFAICRELRAANVSSPIVILTAKDEPIDEVLGLELGADEYIVKPAEPRVLLARLRAIQRRIVPTGTRLNGESLRFGALRIERATRSVTFAEKDVPLSAADFDLLWFLACNVGEVMSRDDILSAMRGLQYDGVTRSIDTRISRLRKRMMETSGRDDVIKTVRPRGYMFCALPD